MKNLNELSDKEKKELFDSLDAVVTDCDGVIWLGNSPIVGSVSVMNQFKKVGKKIFFVTNNSTKVRKELVAKAENLGFLITLDEMISTAWLTAVYLKSINFKNKVYIIGANSITEELDLVGIQSTGTGPDPFVNGTTLQTPLDPDIGAVVVGHDIHFSYPKMVKACSYLRNEDCLFIATNTDPSLPLPDHKVAPGAGTFVKAVETCTGRVSTIVGKPSKITIEEILKEKGVNPEKTLMIGDRCSTDIAFGNACNMKTLLVLSGVNNLYDVEKYKENNETNMIPTYFADSIADVLKVIEAGMKQ